MNQTSAYNTIGFFVCSFFITSVAWLSAAYASYQLTLQHLLFPLIFAGMSGPAISAMRHILRN